MRRAEIMEAMRRVLARSRPVPITFVRKRYMVKTKAYEDGEIFGAVLDYKLEPPRLVVKYLDEDTLCVLHPTLRCTTTYTDPLYIYIRFKSDSISFAQAVPIPLIGRFVRARLGEEEVVASFTRLSRRFPTLVRAVMSLPEEIGDELVIVDGRRASLLELVSCPMTYGLYIREKVVIYVGRK